MSNVGINTFRDVRTDAETEDGNIDSKESDSESY